MVKQQKYFETNLDELLGQFPEPPNSYEPFEKTKDVAYSPISPYPLCYETLRYGYRAIKQAMMC